MREQEKIKKIRFEELRAEIMLGIEDLRAGRSQTFSSGEEVFEEIKRRGRKTYRDNRKKKNYE